MNLFKRNNENEPRLSIADIHEQELETKRRALDEKVALLEGLSPQELRQMAIRAYVNGKYNPEYLPTLEESGVRYQESIALSNLALLGVAFESQVNSD